MVSALETLVKNYGFDGNSGADLKRIAQKVTPWLQEAFEPFEMLILAHADLDGGVDDMALLAGLKAAQTQHWQLMLTEPLDARYEASARKLAMVYFEQMKLPQEIVLAGYAQASTRVQTLLMTKGLPFWGRKKSLARDVGLVMRSFQLDMGVVIEAHLSEWRARQEEIVGALEHAMERMSAKDFSTDIPAPEGKEYPPAYERVRLAFNTLQSNMRSVIKAIKYATDDLKLTALEVNDGANDLARRTESQAATLDRTAQSLSQISESVQDASTVMQSTDCMMRETHVQAETGQAVMSETVAKMREIAESSLRISQITTVIDDIAFQTNLLALNAGVEAARAGEAGRGFAVVASEVRGLAQRAGDAAKEINELIKESGEQVENGVALVDRAGVVLEDILVGVEKVAGLSADVAQSGGSQSDGLAEIAKGISHLDGVTQQNAAMVEQTAAAVASMQRDTTQVSKMIEGFQLRAADEEMPVEIFASSRAA